MDQKKLRQFTAVNQVIEEMKRLVANGTFRPRQMLPPENTLAESFGVSRPTVRQANKVLTNLGILQSESGKGTVLSERSNVCTEALVWSVFLKNDDFRQLMELRNVIEEDSIESLIVQSAQDSERFNAVVREMEVLLQEMKDALDSGDSARLVQSDLSFHQTIILSNQNSLVRVIFKTLESFLNDEISVTMGKSRSLNHCHDLHKKLLLEIKAGRKDGAIEAFRNHSKTLMESFA